MELGLAASFNLSPAEFQIRCRIRLRLATASKWGDVRYGNGLASRLGIEATDDTLWKGLGKVRSSQLFACFFSLPHNLTILRYMYYLTGLTRL